MTTAGTRPRWWLHASTIVVFVGVMALTIAVSFSAQAVHDNNEDRLLQQRVQEAATIFSGTIPNVQTPLASAAEVAEASDANRASFAAVMDPLVGPGRRFVSAAIWPAKSANAPRPVTVVGDPPALASMPASEIRALLTRAISQPQLVVAGLFDLPRPRVAYAFSSIRRSIRYVAYAEAALPKDRTNVKQSGPTFTDLGYALYLGSDERAQNLLAASTPDLPLRGRRDAVTLPYGDNSIRVVMTTESELGGGLLARLPWLLFAFGVLLAFVSSGLTERLVRRRDHAQRLADENARLYAAQRTVAQTLQHSLLPETLPAVEGIVLGVRYIPGVEGVDIGGDWYDAIPLTDGRVMVVVGDVSGRGLRAATIMASLRYAIRAYAAQGDDPATILTKLAALLNVEDDGHFATVLCGLVDVASHEVTLANAAHPQPLVLGDGRAEFLATSVGVPIGVKGPSPYVSVTRSVPPDATLLAFTDGLIERRGESLDIGLARLRVSAMGTVGSLDDLLTKVVDDLARHGSADDTAILGVRWKS